MPVPNKLSATALSTFLRSPRMYYYRYICQIEPIVPSVANFDEAKIFGILWADFVDRFYRGFGEGENTSTTLAKWLEQTEGWVPDRKREALTRALTALMPQYYQQFRPDDGMRTYGSELKVENDLFLGILDGLGDGNIVHEVKSTSRSPQLAEQAWFVQHSLQSRLYMILADAQGIGIEFAFKDPPYGIFRTDVFRVTRAQKITWECELRALATTIRALGDDPDSYPCHTAGCCMATKGYVSPCPYQIVCDLGLTEAVKLFYRPKTQRVALCQLAEGMTNETVTQK